MLLVPDPDPVPGQQNECGFGSTTLPPVTDLENSENFSSSFVFVRKVNVSFYLTHTVSRQHYRRIS
jgi:hypothetical protein